MGVVTQILLVVFSILSFIGIALFGHVPRLRNTPIGYAHRFITYTIPRWLWRVDYFLTGGCICSSTKRCGLYLMEDKHPLVVIFYLTLITGGLYMFIHDGWQHLSTRHRILVPIISSLPYISMYMAAYSDPGIVTRVNLDTALKIYPYDNILFHPKVVCRTCLFVKPARSKHCSICKHCISKHDHHCIWINNCVGHKNTRHFLAFLMATNIFLGYGAYLTLTIMNDYISKAYLKGRPISILPWGPYFRLWGIGLLDETFIGAVFLLSFMCGILSYTFTGYHIYLIWAGTTTNETFKWSDWKDDIKYGEIYIADDTPELSYTYQVPPPTQEAPIPTTTYHPSQSHTSRSTSSRNEYEEEEPNATVNWPIKKRQHLARIGNDQHGPESLPKEVQWRRVRSLNEIENIYDLGFKRNLEGVLWPKKL